MSKIITELHDLDYNFIDFGEILVRIRNSFLTEMENLGFLGEICLNSRLQKKFLRHCVLEEIFRSYEYVNIGKTNVILIQPSVNSTFSGGLLDDKALLDTILSILDSCKRKLPILMKKYDGNLPFDEFLCTTEGKEFLMTVDSDKCRLRKSICTFKRFKLFAKTNKLSYIVDNMLDDIKFKKLFIS